MQRLALLALAVSAAFAVSAPAMARACHTDRNCPRGDYCRITALPPGHTYHGVCKRRGHDAPPADTATPPPASGSQTMCPMIYQPVCGADGKTYPNQCHATRAGAKVSHAGAC